MKKTPIPNNRRAKEPSTVKNKVASRQKKQESGSKTCKAQYLNVPSPDKFSKAVPNKRYSNIAETPFEDERIEIYENMLKKVNDEFKVSLAKNNDLSKKIGQLEFKLIKTEDELAKAQHFIDAQNKAKKEKGDMYEIEKSDLEKLNQELAESIKQKDMELKRVKSSKFELENRLLQSQASHNQEVEAEIELRDKIGDLVTKLSELESQLNEKEADLYKTNSINEAMRKDLEKYEQLQSKYELELNL